MQKNIDDEVGAFEIDTVLNTGLECGRQARAERGLWQCRRVVGLAYLVSQASLRLVQTSYISAWHFLANTMPPLLISTVGYYLS
jgi:hypothetical protein